VAGQATVLERCREVILNVRRAVEAEVFLDCVREQQTCSSGRNYGNLAFGIAESMERTVQGGARKTEEEEEEEEEEEKKKEKKNKNKNRKEKEIERSQRGQSKPSEKNLAVEPN
jgi:hypothetical protein